MEPTVDSGPGKAEIRKQANDNRRQQPDKERLSEAICRDLRRCRSTRRQGR